MSPFRVVLSVCVLVAVSLALAPAAGAADASIIVKFKPGTPAEAERSLLDLPGVGSSVGTIAGVNADVVTVSQDPARMARLVGRSAHVEYAEPNRVLRTQATPNDPFFADQYGFHNTGQTGGTPDADIDAPEGWDAAGLATFPNSGGATVGIVDTGIDRAHPDLAGKTAGCATSISAGTMISNGVCDDDNGHGTHVAGTVAANTNNGIGVAGTAFNSRLVICKALHTAAGTGLTSDVANCINWTAAQGVDVISMSLGGGESETLRRAVQNAHAGGAGPLQVAAAGNDGDATLNYPAAYQEVVSVAATDNRDARASFSNANGDVEIAAPGVDILSTFLGTTYIELSGTSMATPHVAGVASLLFDRDPAASSATIRSRLTAAVDDLGPAGRDPSFGFGRVNLCKAMGGAC
jgi:thermitase